MKRILSPLDSSLPVYAWSLGCPKNRVDTEKTLGSLGLDIKAVERVSQAALVFINTCAFIEPASRESLQAIFEITRKIKRLKRKPLLAVAGCLPGRYGISELAREISEVDLWLDSSSQAAWPDKIAKALKLNSAPKKGRFISTASYAWLKIAEGCLHNCAFCAIPAIRGPLRSEQASDLLEEATQAIKNGAKELILVAQDTTSWGRDFIMTGNAPGPKNLANLLQLLAEIPDLEWLRLLYLYPNSVNDDLLNAIGAGAPILPYLDLPFQHASENVLSRMGRPFKINPRQVIEKIRTNLPGAALRATLITGYPGETEKDFANLCQFVQEARFQNLGVFAYQAEDGTKAAQMPEQIPEPIRFERRDEIMRIQREISRDLLTELVGTRQKILVDKALPDQWPGLHAGRVWFQAPEIDGLTYISGPEVKEGAIVEAEIVDAQDYDLSALA